MSRKDIRALIRRLRKQGWQAVILSSGHWRLTNPDGERITMSATPSNHRAFKNARADARRRGGKV